MRMEQSIKDIVRDIDEFERKSGIKLYNQIKVNLGKVDGKLGELKASRESWKEKYFKQKKKEDNKL
jgi:hypothetical protein